MNYGSPPNELNDFLIWLKQRSEEVWSEYQTPSLEDFRRARYLGSDWKQGTKWLGGFSDAEIDSFEQTWNLRFPADYRLFLRLLGAPNRSMVTAGYRGRDMVQGECPSFYHWGADVEAIQYAMASPLEGLLFDVENNVLWLDSWGVRPNDVEGRRQRLSELIQGAPPLIPIIGHRYLVGTPVKAGNPVLSVHQSDIIFYGSDLRKFLITELSDLLEINHEEAYQKAVEEITETSYTNIPFWGEIMLSWWQAES
jgi:hypothetical protein